MNFIARLVSKRVRNQDALISDLRERIRIKDERIEELEGQNNTIRAGEMTAIKHDGNVEFKTVYDDNSSSSFSVPSENADSIAAFYGIEIREGK